ncbi:MAG: ExeM/NucH family extracellular endonuclease [Xanthomonadales bacterium]|jgi:hypothetical protein|nr:ExeM/NucH family extracellular endonuclease [Xanthomonadales bacterium]
MSRAALSLLWLSLCTLTACEPSPPPASAAVQDPCQAAVTGIHAIQGSGLRSPKLGERVTIRAIVTTPYLPGLGGFFVQQATEDRDGDPASSEGLFVQADGGGARRGPALTRDAADAETEGDVQPGMVLRLSGVVGELGDPNASLTTLTEVSERLLCGSTELPTPASIESAQLVVEDWEAFEGMRVSLDAPLTLIGNDQLFRRGELVVSFTGRQFQPTQRQPPGEGARKLDIANRAARLILDDRSEADWPERVRYLPERVTADRPYRVGSQIAEVAGILDQRAGRYRLQVDGRISVQQAPRPPLPELDGRIRVMAYNVLNLFNGDGQGGEFPTPRGATTPEEHQRQLDKVVAAIRAVNADVVGLMEIENDGLEANSALRQFVDALNRGQPAARRYSAVDPGMPTLGSDQISVAIIYRKHSIETVGPALSLTEAPFDQRHRAPLMQRFRDRQSGGSFAVVVNHWKSKSGCQDADSANADRGDLQGCWNAARVDAARALAGWIQRESNVWNDDDVLILGDLNAYAQEDPLRLLAQEGYERLEPGSEAGADYTLIFDAAVGALDHAVVSTSLRPQVASVAIWHINADEMPDFDYNIDKRSKAQKALYRPDPYRSSDHDPVIVGLNPVP